MSDERDSDRLAVELAGALRQILDRQASGTGQIGSPARLDENSLLDTIRDVLSRPLPGTRDTRDWPGGEDSWEALRSRQEQEREALHRRHEQEREALSRRHEQQREAMGSRRDGERDDDKHEREERKREHEREKRDGGPGRGRGLGRGRGRGKGKD